MNFFFNTADGRFEISISEKYTEYLNQRRNVIYTCITNGYNDVPDSFFIDENSVEDESELENIIFLEAGACVDDYFDPRIVVFRSSGADPRYIAKVFKIFPQVFMPNLESSVWMDGNVRLSKSIDGLLKDFLASKRGFGVFKHNKRKSVLEELSECVRFSKDAEDVMKSQVNKYRAKYNLDVLGLYQGRFLLRNHHRKEIISKISDEWWAEVSRYSVRDQLSLPVIVFENCLDVKVYESQDLSDVAEVYKHKRYLNYNRNIGFIGRIRWLLGKIIYTIR